MRQHCVGLTAVGLMLLALIWCMPFLALGPAAAQAQAGVRTPAAGAARPQPTRNRPSPPAATPGLAVTRSAPGGAQLPADVPTVSAPVATRSPRMTPGARPSATRTALPAQLPLPTLPLPTLTLPTQLPGAYTPVAAYAAAEMIRSFGSQYLGIEAVVGRAYGASGDLNLPASVEATLGAAVALAGQAAAGGITSNGSRGVAEVAVGAGAISGDLQADISSASAGAFSLVVMAAPPSDAGAALALIRNVYPALAAATLQPASSAEPQSYAFTGSTTHQAVDPKTRQATVVVTEIVAGTTGQGGTTLVWAALATGELATAWQ